MMSHSWSGTIKRVVFCCGEVAEQVLMAQAIIKLLNPLPCRRHLLIERRMQLDIPTRYTLHKLFNTPQDSKKQKSLT